MFFQCLVSENTSWTYFYKIATEFIFKCPIFMPSKINMIPGSEYIQIFTTRIIPVKPDTPVALNAPVHLMTDKWYEVLIIIGSFGEIKSPVIVAGHHCHIL